MKKVSVTQSFAILGMAIWLLTILLRSYVVYDHRFYQFIIGIAPNIGAPLVMIRLLELLYERFMKKTCQKKMVIIFGLVTLFSVIVSEILHDILGSPFDMNDVIASVVSVGLMLSVYLLHRGAYESV